MAILLCEHVSHKNVDVLRVIKMVIIHDIVEIDAGDTYCFDAKAALDQNCREQRAAERLFGILPSNQAQEMQELWEEFEEQVTVEARFAGALDRLQPLLLHCNTEGESWKTHGITSQKVIERNKRTKEISESLGSLVDELINDAITKGYLVK